MAKEKPNFEQEFTLTANTLVDIHAAAYWQGVKHTCIVILVIISIAGVIYFTS